MTDKVSQTVRHKVRERAKQRCEYCQTPEWLIGLPHEIDHIIPRAHGGTSNSQNLYLACSSCNGHKHAKIEGYDPQTALQIPLFHPRQQDWYEHFAWNEDGTQIVGQTPCGRATIGALQLNHPLVVGARAIWVQFGYHPQKCDHI